MCLGRSCYGEEEFQTLRYLSCKQNAAPLLLNSLKSKQKI